MNLTIKFILVSVLSAAAGAGVVTIRFEQRDSELTRLLQAERQRNAEQDKAFRKALSGSRVFPGNMADSFKKY